MLVLSKHRLVTQCLWNKQTYGWMVERMSSQAMCRWISLSVWSCSSEHPLHLARKLGSGEGYHLLVPKSLTLFQVLLCPTKAWTLEAAFLSTLVCLIQLVYQLGALTFNLYHTTDIEEGTLSSGERGRDPLRYLKRSFPCGCHSDYACRWVCWDPSDLGWLKTSVNLHLYNFLVALLPHGRLLSINSMMNSKLTWILIWLELESKQ